MLHFTGIIAIYHALILLASFGSVGLVRSETLIQRIPAGA